MCVFIRHHRWEKQFSWSFCHEKHFVNGKIHFQFYHVWNWSKNIRISPQKSNIFFNTYFHSVPHMTKNHENSCCSSVPQGKKLILMKFFFIFFTYIFFFFNLVPQKNFFLINFSFHTQNCFSFIFDLFIWKHTHKKTWTYYFFLWRKMYFYTGKKNILGGVEKGKKDFTWFQFFFLFFFF